MTPRPYVPTFGESDVALPEDTQERTPKTTRAVGAPASRPRLIKQGRVKPRPHADGWYVVQAFGDALRAERERRGWTLVAACAHIGMGGSQYRKLENGHSAPTIRTANRMMRRLGIAFTLGDWPE